MADIAKKLQDQKELRAIRARRRFKAAVLHVIHNMYWIDDNDYDKSEPASIRQSVARFCHPKETRIFKIEEIAMLRKHADYRTKEEISHLYNLIGKLHCFRPYPEHVQLELVGVTYFEYYGPNKVLIKQNQEGHAMYFILSGEVAITKSVWDEITNSYVEETVATLASGKIFGELSLLQNIPRTATVTTKAPCQLLVLKKDDFDRILKVNMMEQWEEIAAALKKFKYFDYWDNVLIRECCLKSKMKSYSLNQIVYGDRKPSKQSPKMTYFLIKGSCSVVEHMYIKETVNRGKKQYAYQKPPELDIGEKTSSSTLSQEKDHSPSIVSTKSLNIGNNQINTSILPKSNSVVVKERSTILPKTTNVVVKESSNVILKKHSKTDTKISDQPTNFKELIRTTTKMLLLNEPVTKDRTSRGTSRKISKFIDKRSSVRDDNIFALQHLLQQEKEEENIVSHLDIIQAGYDLVFIQICTLEEKASFKEDDLMKHRRVIALCPVKVLLIPTYWLEQQNRGNVWNRINTFLHHRIPSTEQVFKAYVDNKKWIEYKKKLKHEILSKRKISNNTTIHDVPYSIRVMNKYH